MKKFIITESEKNRILGLHNSKKPVLKEATVKDLQSLLLSKGYELGKTGPKGDGVDGILGNKTLSAIEKELEITATASKESPETDETPVADVEPNQQPPTQQMTPETPQSSVTPEAPAQTQSTSPK
jgi:hypothetical protein